MVQVNIQKSLDYLFESIYNSNAHCSFAPSIKLMARARTRGTEHVFPESISLSESVLLTPCLKLLVVKNYISSKLHAAKFGWCQYTSRFSPIWVIGSHDSGAMTHCVPLAWSKCIKLGFHNTKDSSNLQKRDSAGWRGLAFINLAHLCHPRQKTKFAELTLTCLFTAP